MQPDRAQPRPRYSPYASGAHRLAVGLSPLDPRDWFEPDASAPAQMANKRALLQSAPQDVVRALPESAVAQAELLSILARHLLARHWDLYAGGTDSIRVLTTGEDVALGESALAPIDRAGRLVQEDLCLLQEQSGHYVLTAASLCAPAGWRLADKLGHPMLEIHAPVPGYAEELARRVARIFSALRPGQPVWRANWSLATEPTLFMPHGHAASEEQGYGITPANAGEKVWVRVERQTLTRLPASDAILFTIKTHIDPLSLLRGHAQLREGLAGSIETMRPEMQAYKAIARYKAAVLTWLRSTERSTS